MNSNLYKGSLETIILTLFEEKGEWYGYEIVQRIKILTDGEIDIKEGSLYPLLHKMESEEILSSTIRKVENRNRKYYRLSETGVMNKIQMKAAMLDYLKMMNHILNPKRTSS